MGKMCSFLFSKLCSCYESDYLTKIVVENNIRNEFSYLSCSSVYSRLFWYRQFRQRETYKDRIVATHMQTCNAFFPLPLPLSLPLHVPNW